MEDAPLNLAHYHGRRAESHLKRHKYDEAITSHKKAIIYIEKALETVSTEIGKNCLQLQTADHSKQIQQIEYKKLYYEKLKRLSSESTTLKNIHNKDCDNTTTTTAASSSDDSSYGTKGKSSCNENELIWDIDERGDKCKKESSTSGENINSNKTTNDAQQQSNQDDEEEERISLERALKDIPHLAPLELPIFDLSVLQFTKSSNFNNNEVESLDRFSDKSQ